MIVIFDWDGTLCDSIDQIVSAMQAAAREVGLGTPSVQAVTDIVGLGLPQAIAILFPRCSQEARERVEVAYSKHFVAGDRGPATLFKGALATLDALRNRGFELAVATGKSRRGLSRVLAGLDMTQAFHASRCADETRSKPHPLMLEEILTERGKSPRDALMVGDTEYDLDMAARAGIPSVGVSYGVHDTKRLQRHGPVAIVDELPELLELPLLRAHDRRSTG